MRTFAELKVGSVYRFAKDSLIIIDSLDGPGSGRIISPLTGWRIVLLIPVLDQICEEIKSEDQAKFFP